MKRKKVIITTGICIIALIIGLLIYTFAVPPLARLFVESSPSIQAYREPTDREQFLAERIRDAIMEEDKIQDCEVLVLLDDEPVQPFVSLILENNIKFADFTDSDIEAIKTTVSNISMDIAGVVIDGENISMVIGEAE